MEGIQSSTTESCVRTCEASVLMKFGKRQNKNTSRLYTKTKWEFLSLKKTLFHTIYLALY